LTPVNLPQGGVTGQSIYNAYVIGDHVYIERRLSNKKKTQALQPVKIKEKARAIDI